MLAKAKNETNFCREFTALHYRHISFVSSPLFRFNFSFFVKQITTKTVIVLKNNSKNYKIAKFDYLEKHKKYI